MIGTGVKSQDSSQHKADEEAWIQSVSEVAVSVHLNILNQNPGPGTWIQRTLCMDKPITIPRSRVNLILFNFSPQLCEGSSWVECV